MELGNTPSAEQMRMALTMSVLDMPGATAEDVLRATGGGGGNAQGRQCRFFAAGICRYGSQCRFVHDEAGGAASVDLALLTQTQSAEDTRRAIVRSLADTTPAAAPPPAIGPPVTAAGAGVRGVSAVTETEWAGLVSADRCRRLGQVLLPPPAPQINIPSPFV